MRDTLSVTPAAEETRRYSLQVPKSKLFEWIGLAAVVLLAAVLLFTNISAIGQANTYYTAAVKAMLQSWHNFFFVAAEPGGSVSVDKPPVGLWLETISAYFLGVSGFSVVLPQILAGIGSVIVLYHLIRRKYGVVAGLLAALVLAITPVVIATDRNNTIDSTLIFTLLLAAWAFIKATETSKLRYLLLGAVLVGIGFNIKMLEAYLPLPAFYAMYFLGSNQKIWKKIGHLALTSVLLLTISLSWAVAVDLTPASQRPYVGSSGDNSELSLIIGYNGIDRLIGMFGLRRAASSTSTSGSSALQSPPTGTNNFQPPAGSNNTFQPPADGQPGATQNGQTFDRTRFANNNGGGMFNTGQTGPLRLFTAPLSNQVSWLLPFGLLSILIVAFRNRVRWPVKSEHQDIILWGGWLLTTAVFFSIAGFFHQYYLSTMAPPLAGLVAIGLISLWQMHRDHPWIAFALLFLGAGGTLLFQAYTATSFTTNTWWLYIAAGSFAAGVLILLVGLLKKIPHSTIAGFACVVAALLVTPGIWSGLTTMSTDNQTLPAAYSGSTNQFGGGFGRDGQQVNQTLLTYLEQNTQGMRYMVAVPSSQQGTQLVLASGRGVLYMGGFSGQDQVVTSTDLANLVKTGQLRFIELGGGGMGGNSQSGISSWVTSKCSLVQGLNNSSSSSTTQSGNNFFRGDNFQTTLYDCASAQ